MKTKDIVTCPVCAETHSRYSSETVWRFAKQKLENEKLALELEWANKRIAVLTDELEWANKRIAVLTEALESIAFKDEPAADTIDYWQKIIDEKDNKIAETLANDTTIARDALKDK